jgi:hypothetical protein
MKDYSARTGRTFSEITEEERLELKLATTLKEEWYKSIDAFSYEGKSQKRARIAVVMVLVKFQQVM